MGQSDVSPIASIPNIFAPLFKLVLTKVGKRAAGGKVYDVKRTPHDWN